MGLFYYLCAMTTEEQQKKDEFYMQRALLGGSGSISLAVLVGSIEVFTQGVELVALLHSLFGSTATEEHAGHDYNDKA